MANYQTYKKINGTDAILNNTVGPGQVTGVSTGVAHQLYVYNCCHYDANNGGCCLAWTVPALTTTVRFELTGGGGSGSPGQCCANGPSGGSGAYAVKTMHSYKGDFTAASTQYTICAGGSTRCSCCSNCTNCWCCGVRGCRSYVTGGSNLSGFCAEGGTYGFHMCANLGCYSCSHIQQCDSCLLRCACWNGADWGAQGASGHRQQNHYCHGTVWSISGPSVSPWASNSQHTVDRCSHGSQQACCSGHSIFPGGGGHSPFNDGSCCWSGWGQGGLVVVSYWQ